MAKPNYAYAKRQRDLAKKQKKEEKRLRKAEGARDATAAEPGTEADDTQLGDSQGAATSDRPAAAEDR